MKISIILLLGFIFLASCSIAATPTGATRTISTQNSGMTPSPSGQKEQEITPEIEPVTEESTPVNQVVSTSTPIPGGSPPTESFENFQFAELIHFYEGGGGGSCLLYGQAPPVVFSLGERGFPDSQSSDVCLVGFPAGERVDVLFLDPIGRSFEYGSIHIPEVPISDGDETFTSVYIPVFHSFNLSDGNWKVIVDWSGGRIEETLFPHLVDSLFHPDAKTTHNRYPPGTLVNPGNLGQQRPYQPGEIIFLQGKGYMPDSHLPLGIYYGNNEMELVSPVYTSTDSAGTFNLTIQVDDLFQRDGYYSIVPAGYYFDDEATSPLKGFATFQVQNQLPYQVCEGVLPSQLLVGDKVKLEDDAANNLRIYPSTHEERVGEILPGEQVLLLDGPECAEGYVWWYVIDLTSGIPGWTAEGDANKYWLTKDS